MAPVARLQVVGEGQLAPSLELGDKAHAMSGATHSHHSGDEEKAAFPPGRATGLLPPYFGPKTCLSQRDSFGVQPASRCNLWARRAAGVAIDAAERPAPHGPV